MESAIKIKLPTLRRTPEMLKQDLPELSSFQNLVLTLLVQGKWPYPIDSKQPPFLNPKGSDLQEIRNTVKDSNKLSHIIFWEIF